MKSARALSTRSLYDYKWQAFEKWCDLCCMVRYLCSVADVLGFLHDLMKKGKSFSTIKVYLEALGVTLVSMTTQWGNTAKY